ncbi:hypothetical protein VTH06DRAFT_1182 [Thermothelomyces fergusii]
MRGGSTDEAIKRGRIRSVMWRSSNLGSGIGHDTGSNTKGRSKGIHSLGTVNIMPGDRIGRAQDFPLPDEGRTSYRPPSFHPIGINAAATFSTPRSVASMLYCDAAFLVSNTSSLIPRLLIARRVAGLRGRISGPSPRMSRSVGGGWSGAASRLRAGGRRCRAAGRVVWIVRAVVVVVVAVAFLLLPRKTGHPWAR